jgi:putative endonuclease
MAKHNYLGKQGEKIAKDLLHTCGYEICECNWRAGRAEIDIIARIEDTLVFVEVKTRSTARWGEPEIFVSPRKQKLMLHAAGAYMDACQYEGEIRFDIIAITITEQGQPSVNHYEDVFFPMN